MKHGELKEREVKINREIQQLFFKSIVSIDDMDKFEQNEIKKVSPIKNTCYDWLINFILEPRRKRVSGFKDKIASLCEKNTPKKLCMGEERN